jgi:putative ABC transport system permease protein
MRWYQRLFRRARTEKRLNTELRVHLEQQIADYIATGMTPEEARRRARLEFGGLDQVKEECRDVGAARFVETLIQDLRYGLRQLRRDPGFTVVAVITLAVGVGVNSAIFSLVNAVLLQPLPYPNSGQLVHVDWLFRGGNVPSVTGEEYGFWKQHSRVFQSAAAYSLFPDGFNLLAGAEPQYVKGWAVSRDFFQTFGTQPFLGRGFTKDEEQPGGPRAVVLRYGLWKGRFGASRNIVGRNVILDGQGYSVVGVMPRGFGFSLPYAPTGNIQVWLPLRLVPDPNHHGHNYLMVARLKRGVSLAQAQADMGHVLAEIRRAVPGYVDPGERGATLIPYQEWITGDVRGPLLILMFAVSLVLLIASVNFSNLLIARGSSRQTEMAVRLALGAGLGRVRRQLITESVLVALAGGTAAIIAAPWAARLLVAISPQELPLAGEVRVDFRVLLFTLLVAALAGIAAGLAPAFRLRRLDVGPTLKEGARTSSAGFARERGRRWLVGVEIALSTLLLSGALLLTFSLIALERVRPGFDAQDLWSFHISLTPAVSRTNSAIRSFEEGVLERLKEIPGVKSASVASSLPLEPSFNFEANVKRGDQESQVYVDARSIDPHFFQTMAIPVLNGRAFTESDTATSPPVVIVNQAFAQQCCHGRGAIGSLVFAGFEGKIGGQIVGVVGNTKEDAMNAPSPPVLYFPQAQLRGRFARGIYLGLSSSWAIRTSTPPDFAEIQRAVGQVNPSEAVGDLQPTGKIVAESLASNQFEALLMAVFAVIALLLAAIGLYGIASYLVVERTHEIGIRVALGAHKYDVFKLVIGQGLKLALVGVAIGVAGAFAFTRFLSSLLYGVKPTDPLTLIIVSVILVAVALVACFVPARRAAKVDPMTALRHE